MTTALRKKIEDRSARVAIVGIGYVGLPTMIALANAKFRVTGIDLNEERVRQIKEKALRKLRHPTRGRKLIPYSNEG